MTKRKAKRLLRKQKGTILKHGDINTFMLNNLSYFKRIFGEDSFEFMRLKAFTGVNPPDKALLIKLFSDSIEVVENLGTLDRGNYLSRLSDTMLSTIIIFVLGATFAAGRWVGVRESLPFKPTNNITSNNTNSNNNKMNNKIHSDSIKSK